MLQPRRDLEVGALEVRDQAAEVLLEELGISDEHEGILVLPDNAPVGARLASYMGGDTLEVEVTPNRGDCLSVLGIAREVAALTGEQATEPPLDYPEGEEPAGVRVEIEDVSLCARYTAAVIRGVRIGPSPDWLQRRLIEADQRPINAVVDATNYVMLEMGQPLHAFDLDQVRQGAIVVRPARPGERLTTLDGTERTLQPPMLVIADPERAIGKLRGYQPFATVCDWISPAPAVPVGGWLAGEIALPPVVNGGATGGACGVDPVSAPDAEAVKKWMELATPGKEHRALSPFVGTWNTISKFWMAGPDSEPMVSKGEAELKFIMGGRFLSQTATGRVHGRTLCA